VTNPIALGKALHVRINREQNRIIGECGGAYTVIVDAFGKRLPIQNYPMTARLKCFANRIGNARVQKDSENGTIRIKPRRYA